MKNLMKRMFMILATVFGIGGCTGEEITNVQAVGNGFIGLFNLAGDGVTKIITWLTTVSMLVVLLIGVVGCTSMYPKFMDSPEFQKAAVEAFNESAKTISGNANLSNPEVEFYYKMSVGGRVIGVNANVQGSGTTTGRTTTQPVK